MSKRCKEHNWKISEFNDVRDKMVCKNCGKTDYKKISQNDRVKRVIDKFPFLGEVKLNYSKQRIIKYAKAVERYPDLKELPFMLVLKAYDFREEVLRTYQTEYITKMTDARCDVRLGKFSNFNIPKDLPALKFKDECIICREQKRGLYICPECWQSLRENFDITSEDIREIRESLK